MAACTEADFVPLLVPCPLHVLWQPWDGGGRGLWHSALSHPLATLCLCQMGWPEHQLSYLTPVLCRTLPCLAPAPLRRDTFTMPAGWATDPLNPTTACDCISSVKGAVHCHPDTIFLAVCMSCMLCKIPLFFPERIRKK